MSSFILQLFVLVSMTPLCAAILEFSEDPEEIKSIPYFEKIKTARKKKSSIELVELAQKMESEWPGEKDPWFYRALVELIDAIKSVSPGEADLIRKLAISALDSNKGIPVDSEIKLLLYIQRDEDLKISPDDWLMERLSRVRRWMTAWRHLQREKEVWLKKETGPIELNVQPPPGTFLPGGVSPEAIKDPILRKKYEEAIKKNSERIKAGRMQSDLVFYEKQLSEPLKRYIVSAYARPPFKIMELEADLDSYEFDQAIREGILQAVRKKTGESQIGAKKTDISKGLTVERIPPVTSLFRDDLRLRKKITFQKKSPKVEDYLVVLTQATGVVLNRADDIQNKLPVRGSAAFNSIPAWQIMELLAAYKQVEGRWEKDGDGYRLVSNGKTPEIPEVKREQEKQAEADSRTWLYAFIGGGAVLVLLLAAITRRRK